MGVESEEWVWKCGVSEGWVCGVWSGCGSVKLWALATGTERGAPELSTETASREHECTE